MEEKLMGIVNALGNLTLGDLLNVLDTFSDCDVENMCYEGDKIINQQLMNKPINNWSNQDRLIFTLAQAAGVICAKRKNELNKKLRSM